MSLTKNEIVRFLEKHKKDPIKFFVDCLDVKEEHVWGKMRELAYSVRDNKKTVAKAGNGVSKTFSAARLALWFLYCHYPSTVITTAPSHPQVEELLWREIRLAHANAKIPLGGHITKTKLELGEKWFAYGFATKPDTVTQQATRFQGFHNDHLLIIFDEAAGILPEIWEAKDRLMTSGHVRFLGIGNPTSPNGNFPACFTHNSGYNQITISVHDTPNYKENKVIIPGLSGREFEDEVISEYGKDSMQYKSSITGEIPQETEHSLIRFSWVEAARNRESEDYEEDSARIEACDVASKHGQDETVITYRYGHTIKSIRPYRQIPSTKTRDILALDYLEKSLSNLVIDADGMGEFLDDMLQERHVPFSAFHGGYGQKAFDKRKFKNLRTQFYYIVAKKFEKGIYSLKLLPEKEYQILKYQLCSIQVKPPDALGREQIETKEDMAARNVKSPDYADSFMMTEYGFYMGKMADIQPYRYR